MPFHYFISPSLPITSSCIFEYQSTQFPMLDFRKTFLDNNHLPLSNNSIPEESGLFICVKKNIHSHFILNGYG